MYDIRNVCLYSTVILHRQRVYVVCIDNVIPVLARSEKHPARAVPAVLQ